MENERPGPRSQGQVLKIPYKFQPVSSPALLYLVASGDAFHFQSLQLQEVVRTKSAYGMGTSPP